MNQESRSTASDEAAVKRALQEAVPIPYDEVDWPSLHGRILAGAEAYFRPGPRGSWDWVETWSSRGIPLAASALVAAVVSLLILPLEGSVGMPLPAEAWPLAEELVAGLPADARALLQATIDTEALLRIAAEGGAQER
jgi:hypothetical protein